MECDLWFPPNSHYSLRRLSVKKKSVFEVPTMCRSLDPRLLIPVYSLGSLLWSMRGKTWELKLGILNLLTLCCEFQDNWRLIFHPTLIFGERDFPWFSLKWHHRLRRPWIRKESECDLIICQSLAPTFPKFNIFQSLIQTWLIRSSVLDCCVFTFNLWCEFWEKLETVGFSNVWIWGKISQQIKEAMTRTRMFELPILCQSLDPRSPIPVYSSHSTKPWMSIMGSFNLKCSLTCGENWENLRVNVLIKKKEKGGGGGQVKNQSREPRLRFSVNS